MNMIELQKSIDEQTGWRKRELLEAEYSVSNAMNKRQKRYLCRSWTLFLYAHVDNFVSESVRIIQRYEKANGVIGGHSEYIWLISRGLDIATDAKHSNYIKPCDVSSNAEIGLNEMISAKIIGQRSLSFKSLRFFCDWVLRIDFDYGSYEAFCITLKQRRDQIAHGEEVYVDLEEDCKPWQRKCFDFFDEFSESLLVSCTP